MNQIGTRNAHDVRARSRTEIPNWRWNAWDGPCGPASVLCSRLQVPHDRHLPAYEGRSQATRGTITPPFPRGRASPKAHINRGTAMPILRQFHKEAPGIGSDWCHADKHQEWLDVQV
jgi:hypothetical protein